MKAIENATTFFHNCETAKGWEACKNYAAQNAKSKALQPNEDFSIGG